MFPPFLEIFFEYRYLLTICKRLKGSTKYRVLFTYDLLLFTYNSQFPSLDIFYSIEKDHSLDTNIQEH